MVRGAARQRNRSSRRFKKPAGLSQRAAFLASISILCGKIFVGGVDGDEERAATSSSPTGNGATVISPTRRCFTSSALHGKPTPRVPPARSGTATLDLSRLDEAGPRLGLTARGSSEREPAMRRYVSGRLVLVSSSTDGSETGRAPADGSAASTRRPLPFPSQSDSICDGVFHTPQEPRVQTTVNVGGISHESDVDLHGRSPTLRRAAPGSTGRALAPTLYRRRACAHSTFHLPSRRPLWKLSEFAARSLVSSGAPGRAVCRLGAESSWLLDAESTTVVSILLGIDTIDTCDKAQVFLEIRSIRWTQTMEADKGIDSETLYRVDSGRLCSRLGQTASSRLLRQAPTPASGARAATAAAAEPVTPVSPGTPCPLHAGFDVFELLAVAAGSAGRRGRRQE